MRRSDRLVLFLLLLTVPLGAQDRPRQDTFTERVEVKVRTIVAIVTDAAGKHLASTPTAADIEVREDGVPAEIVGIERLPHPGAVADPSHQAPLAAGSASPAAPAQVLYIDPQFIYRGSAALYLKTLLPSVEALAERGPLRIVVAGSNPKDLLDSTSDPGLVKAALKKVPAEADGTASLFESRRRLMDSPPSFKEWEMVARTFIARDIERIEASLEGLALWAAKNRSASPTILYLVNDGFELDPTEFYLTCRNICPPSAILARQRYRNQFGSRVPRAAERLSATLVSLGYVVVPLTNGVLPLAKVDGAPENLNPSMRYTAPIAARSIPSPATRALAWQPTDPLYKVAEATGGEVVVDKASFRQALGRFDDAYAISYRSRAAGKSGVRNLEVRARQSGVLVRAARTTAGGALADEVLAHGAAAAALRGEDSGGPLAIAVRMQDARKTGKGLSAGTLVVTTDFAPAISGLSGMGGARARVTLAVETDDPMPFLTSQETDADQSGEGTLWTYEIPITWPREARRVSVLVEELNTGLFGTASTDLR